MMAVNTVSKEGFVGLINKIGPKISAAIEKLFFLHVAIPQMYDTYHWALWATTPFTFLLKTLNNKKHAVWVLCICPNPTPVKT